MLEQLKSRLKEKGWILIHVEGTEDGWQRLLESCCEAAKEGVGSVVFLVLEDEPGNTSTVRARNLVRQILREGLYERDDLVVVHVYTTIEEALGDVDKRQD